MSEYWIQDGGDVDYADGDIGDMNHEAIVIRTVQGRIIDTASSKYHLRNNHGGYFDADSQWDEFQNALAMEFAKEMIEAKPANQKKIEKSVHYDPEPFFKAALKQCGVKQPEYDVANGVGDARDYAMERWGWKTYRNGNVDTWRLTRKDMQDIIKGLDAISDADGWSEKKFKKYRFTINVFSTKKHFYLTVEQMEKWISNPTATIAQDSATDIYGANQDLAKSLMHPHYHNRPGVNPFGDSVLYSFKAFLESINGK
jgi:hypothetical protein